MHIYVGVLWFDDCGGRFYSPCVGVCDFQQLVTTAKHISKGENSIKWIFAAVDQIQGRVYEMMDWDHEIQELRNEKAL